MLSKVTAEFPKDWYKYLPAVFFAYNETPHKATGFSRHEIIFGSCIRGTLSLVRNIWIIPDIPQYQTYNTFLTGLRQRIIKGYQFIHQNLAIAGETQRKYCNRGRKLYS